MLDHFEHLKESEKERVNMELQMDTLKRDSAVLFKELEKTTVVAGALRHGVERERVVSDALREQVYRLTIVKK